MSTTIEQDIETLASVVGNLRSQYVALQTENQALKAQIVELEERKNYYKERMECFEADAYAH